MTKTEAISLFGTRQIDLAKAIGLTKGRISQLPEELPWEYSDRAIGAAVRMGKADRATLKRYREEWDDWYNT